MSDNPHPIDIHVGETIRKRRVLLGVSQVTLADRVGITFQQVQKYERGTNRVSASRLCEIASVLQTNPQYFLPAKFTNQPTKIVRKKK